MIQSIMLTAMGFIAAGLLALLIAPAFWSRAVRLTNQRLRSSLPVSEREIRADKDLLRAEYALKVHQLEREVDQGRLAAHRQQIEINRRDIDIRRLSEALAATDADLSEHRNARNVLEQTVSTRIPLLEASLAETQRHLQARDTAMDEFQAAAERQAAALEDGKTILAQRALEVQRLQSLFQESTLLARDRRSEAGSDNTSALRAEIGSLKARLAERTAVFAADALRPASHAATTPAELIAAGKADADANAAAERIKELELRLRTQSDEVERLRSEAEAIAKASDPAANASVRESKIWLRARIDRIESELERERQTTGRLRADLAASNERGARQAAAHRDNLRRLGNRQAASARDVLRKQDRSDVESPAKPAPVNGTQQEQEAARRPSLTARAREMQRALQGHFGPAAADSPADAIGQLGAVPNTAGTALAPAGANPSTATQAAEAAEDANASGDQPQRARLLERLRGYEQA